MAESRASSMQDALALLAGGDWDGAHRAVQDDPSADAAWIHAHLHRVQGDLANARYWYARAGRPEAAVPLDEERAQIQCELLSGNDRS